MRRALVLAGYDVDMAANGEEALALLADRVPDAIVLDWMIEHVPGIEVCRLLRAKPETRDIPIIMLTARQDEVDRIAGLELGASDHHGDLQQPFFLGIES